VNDDARTDAALIAATAGGDAEAFGVLVRRYVRAATLLATQLAGNREAGEDIVQDAFVVIYKQSTRFDPERPFAPWCFGIVRRLAANRRAREQRRWRLAGLWNWVRGEALSRDPEVVLIASLDAAAAKRAMNMLPPMQRACFELVDVQGLSNEEVARMHGISESTVRQHVFRARAALRSLLNTRREQDS
jgi:RNA polymerase sigma-70 factor (ECF subfamily)